MSSEMKLPETVPSSTLSSDTELTPASLKVASFKLKRILNDIAESQLKAIRTPKLPCVVKKSLSDAEQKEYKSLISDYKKQCQKSILV